MKYYAGLDVSLNTTSICIMNEARKVVMEDLVDTNAHAIIESLKRSKVPLELVGLESGFISHWLYCSLRETNSDIPLKCMDARKVAAALKNNINKTDRKDARGIADLLRAGFYSEVHIKSHEAMQLGSVMQARQGLVKAITSLKSSLRGQLRCYGIRLKATKAGFTDAVADAIGKLPTDLALSLTCLQRSMVELEANLATLDKKLIELAKANEDAQLLQTMPGIGPITALTFISEIDDPKRFTNSRSAAAYFGLTPRQYSSGETCIRMGISKQGSPMMRALLVGAAMSHQRSKKWSKLKAWSMRIAKKHGPRKARVALARKTCTVLHRMLITQEPFRFTDEAEEISVATRKRPQQNIKEHKR